MGLLCTTARHTIYVNVRQVKFCLYKFTLPALHAPYESEASQLTSV